MYPLLGELFGQPIHTYGVMIAIGFIGSIITGLILGRREKVSADFILDIAFWVFIVGLIGARIVFILTRLDYFSEDWTRAYRIWEGGLVFYGGPLAAVPFGVWYVRKKGYSAWKMFDVAMPSVVIAHFFGRLGCLGVGCCHGKATHSIFGIKFDTIMVEPALRGIAVHPTQAYEAVGLLLLYIAMWVRYPKKRYDGEIGILYLLLYPPLRFTVEAFRGDTIRGAYGPMSTSQWISVFVLMIGLYVMRLRKKA